MIIRKVVGSLVLYEGPSRIDGAPIVAVATGLRGRSRNPKTGSMVQTWIIRSDVNPVEAVRLGLDVSVCGGCQHRPVLDGTCYVRVGQAPNQVYKAYVAGRYDRAVDLAAVGDGRVVRLGAYGDPAAVPITVWDALLSRAAGHTGYSHQWRSARLRDVMRYCQASVDSVKQFEQARRLGFGTFRVKPAGDRSKLAGEINCPASVEAGKRTTCEVCQMCAGTDGTRGVVKVQMVTIQAHGSSARRFAA